MFPSFCRTVLKTNLETRDADVPKFLPKVLRRHMAEANTFLAGGQLKSCLQQVDNAVLIPVVKLSVHGDAKCPAYFVLRLRWESFLSPNCRFTKV